MKKEWQKGSTDLAGILILIGIIAIVALSPKGSLTNYSGSVAPGTVTSGSQNSSPSSSSYYSSGATTNYQSLVSLGTGNASYAYQSYEEYITIDNRGNAPLNITGWQLRNGKDKRTYNYGGTLQRFSADVGVIPQGTVFLPAKGVPLMQDVVLGDNERAIITTGSVGVRTPYAITSFKENICTGYIEALPDYAFTPPLQQNCPRPSQEPGIENLDSVCRSFINNLSSCRTPEFNVKTPDGLGPCTTCVNGKLLSSQCAAFIKEHYSYQGCLAFHGKDSNFSLRTWRIFLGRGWEMWGKEYETIELYDRAGQLINFQNYQ